MQSTSLAFQGTTHYDSRADIERILVEISNAQEVEELRITGITLGQQACLALAEVLRARAEVKLVDIQGIFAGRPCDEVHSSLEALSEALTSLQNLTELDLSHNPLGGDAAQPLVHLLTNSPNLEVLRLADTWRGKAGAHIVPDALYAGYQLARERGVPFKLQTIISGKNDNTDDDLEEPQWSRSFSAFREPLNNACAKGWPRLFAAVTGLREVRMYKNGIKAEGFHAICTALASCTQLEVLDLEDNVAELDGAIALAEALPHWKLLRVLNLNECFLSNPGGKVLLKALATTQPAHLCELLLKRNRFCQDTIGMLAQSISSGDLPTLQKLNIGSNYAEESDKCIRALRKAMREIGQEEGLVGTEDLIHTDSDCEDICQDGCKCGRLDSSESEDE